jgi:hypothetical protein
MMETQEIVETWHREHNESQPHKAQRDNTPTPALDRGWAATSVARKSPKTRDQSWYRNGPALRPVRELSSWPVFTSI